MIQAVIFELNGVLVDTDLFSRRAWKLMAKEQGLPFDDRINEKLKNMTFAEGLEFLLRKAKRSYSLAEKVALSARQSDLYSEQIDALNQDHMLPGALEALKKAKEKGIKIAVAGNGENTRGILWRLRLGDLVDTVVDESLVHAPLPDPAVLFLACNRLGVAPENCLAIMDSFPGVEGALRGNMKTVAVGKASGCEFAAARGETLEDIDLISLLDRENS